MLNLFRGRGLLRVSQEKDKVRLSSVKGLKLNNNLFNKHDDSVSFLILELVFECKILCRGFPYRFRKSQYWFF
jgi:hypothetical protein